MERAAASSMDTDQGSTRKKRTPGDINGYALLQQIVYDTLNFIHPDNTTADYMTHWDVEEAVCICISFLRVTDKDKGTIGVKAFKKSKPVAPDADEPTLVKLGLKHDTSMKSVFFVDKANKYQEVKLSLSDVIDSVLKHSNEELKAIGKAQYKFREAHSRFECCMLPKPVGLGRNRVLPEDVRVFGLQGSRLPLKDYQAAGRSLGPLPLLKRIRSLQGKLAGKKNNKLKKTQETGIKAKLGRTIGALKSLCVNQNQRNLIEIGKRDFFNDHLCLQLLHSFKYLKPQSRTRYAAPAYCYCRWFALRGKFPNGPEEQLEAWNTSRPYFTDQGASSCATLSLLDGITEDLTMINSVLAGVIVLPRQEFDRSPKRKNGDPVNQIVEGPRIAWYVPPLKGSATLTGFERAGAEKVFLPTLRVNRPKADQVSPPSLQGGASLKTEEVLAALQQDCQTAHTQGDEVNKGPEPKALVGTSGTYIVPSVRSVKFI